ncbi:hypothetical protein FN846DRAFT_995832 [Sphaerosporella brunnea]|uniref:Uncharacterized protein n=1 Tax=Sphaerosporella brunnea TaxID=1250544 RepID=A0A5J5ELQ3_9PEZI|nr:hypothetical protein FN846DRAFT_995832 [Sphaerosporella brunnea]
MTPVEMDGENSDDVNRFERETTACVEDRVLFDGFVEVDDEFKREIIKKLREKAGGMFLWAELQIKILCRLKRMTLSQIEARLDKLPPNSASAYDTIYDMIETEPDEDDPVNAKNALRWVMCSDRPLSPETWSHAVWLASGVQTKRKGFENHGGLQKFPNPPASYEPTIIDAEYPRRICHNLVGIDSKRNVVQLIHLSVREFLEKKPEFTETPPHAVAAETCLSVLCRASPEYMKGPATACVNEHGLRHLLHAPNRSKRILSLQRSFFRPSLAFNTWLQTAMVHDKELCMGIDPLFVAASYGLAQVCQDLLDDDPKRSSRAINVHGRTAPHAAAQLNHCDVIDILLKFS